MQDGINDGPLLPAEFQRPKIDAEWWRKRSEWWQLQHAHLERDFIRVHDALRRLAVEVNGVVRLEEAQLRALVGNTNVSCVLVKLREAEDALDVRAVPLKDTAS